MSGISRSGIPSSATWEDLRLPTAERSFSLSSLPPAVGSPKNQIEQNSKSFVVVNNGSEQQANMQKSRSQRLPPITKPEDRKNSGRSKGKDSIESSPEEALKYRGLYMNMVSSNLFLLKTLSKVIPTSDLEEMCTCAGKILNKEQSSELIKALIEHEVSVTESEKTLFRRNSMASKYLTAFSNKYGNSIVQKTFSSLIKEVHQKKIYCEINPSRLKSESEIASNQRKLTKLAERFLEAISSSDTNFSSQLKFVCRQLYSYVEIKFPGRGLIAIGGFVCLRLFCPAVLDPTALGIVDTQSSESQRTLTLVAKILQNIANGVYFKEAYMQPLNSLIDRYTKPLQMFFERLLQRDSHVDDEPEVVDIDKEIPSLIFLHRHTVANLKAMEDLIESSPLSEDQEGCVLRLHELRDILDRLGPPAEVPIQSPLLSLPRNLWDSTIDIETEERRDERFQKQFNLNSTESVLYEFSCAHERKIPVHGKMYISHNCFCFFAKVFAFKTTFVILIDEVLSLERDSALPSAIEITTREKSYVFSGISKLTHQLELLKGHWVATKQRVSVASSDVVMSEQEGNREENVTNQANITLLTEHDYKLFTEGAKTITRLRDQHILAEGEHSHSLYQVAKGAVRVEKKVTGEDGNTTIQVLRRMEVNEIFGEISFLEGNTVSASVVADDDEVEVYVVDGAFIESLMVTNPGFAGRFYRFLAISLARRLVAPKMTNPPASKPLSSPTTLDSPHRHAPANGSSAPRSSRASRTSWSATSSYQSIVPLSKNPISPRTGKETPPKDKEKGNESAESEGSGTTTPTYRLKGSKKTLMPNSPSPTDSSDGGPSGPSTPIENPATVKLRTRSRSHSSSHKDEPENRSSGFRQRFSINLAGEKEKEKEKEKAEKAEKADKASKALSAGLPAIGMRMGTSTSPSTQYNSVSSSSSSSITSSSGVFSSKKKQSSSSDRQTQNSSAWTAPSIPTEPLTSASGSAILSISGTFYGSTSSASPAPSPQSKSGSHVQSSSHVNPVAAAYYASRSLSPSKRVTQSQPGSAVKSPTSSGQEDEKPPGSRVERKERRERERERDREGKHSKKREEDSHSKNRFRSLTEKIVNNIK